MLKTRRIEYTLEFFRNAKKPKTVKDLADINFMDDLRYQVTRLVGVSTIIGLNCGLLAYALTRNQLRWYVHLPLCFVIFCESRNHVMKQCMDRIYYPV